MEAQIETVLETDNTRPFMTTPVTTPFGGGGLRKSSVQKGLDELGQRVELGVDDLDQARTDHPKGGLEKLDQGAPRSPLSFRDPGIDVEIAYRFRKKLAGLGLQPETETRFRPVFTDVEIAPPLQPVETQALARSRKTYGHADLR